MTCAATKTAEEIERASEYGCRGRARTGKRMRKKTVLQAPSEFLKEHTILNRYHSFSACQDRLRTVNWRVLKVFRRNTFGSLTLRCRMSRSARRLPSISLSCPPQRVSAAVVMAAQLIDDRPFPERNTDQVSRPADHVRGYRSGQEKKCNRQYGAYRHAEVSHGKSHR